jgi:hypothetical protein
MNRARAAAAAAVLVAIGAAVALAVGGRSAEDAHGARGPVEKAAASDQEQATAPTERVPAVEVKRDLPAAVPAPVVPRAPASKAEDEAGLMERMRRLRGSDPELALELAREGNARFPNSAAAPERASIIIHALAELGRLSDARGEAEQMVNEYPDTPWAREIEAFTGAHPHRNYE